MSDKQLNTKIVNDIKDYPIDKIINNKIKVTINTDNMTVSGTDEASGDEAYM